MAELTGIDLRFHIDSILEEYREFDSIYGYSSRYFFTEPQDFDLSVNLFGKPAATLLGPAAGPHTQLAQNILLSWLHGSRIIELKTVQKMDDLEIPRPCIDIRNIGYNVEWSQELTLKESLQEYVTAWILIHLMPELGIFKSSTAKSFYDTIFDMSIGYDLSGISSDKIMNWLKGMADASQIINELKSCLPQKYTRFKKIEIPGKVSDSITLSTFHGCPADEIEEIVKYLIAEHHLHVVVKMNPTLAGYDFTKNLLQAKLGYRNIELDKSAFETDLSFEQAISMMKRLQSFAFKHNRIVGAKFTNTLVVKNTETFFKESQRYLSGAPLYVLATHLVQKFRQAIGTELPISFSGGVNKDNFKQVVAGNMAPVTTCTDLLKKGGYRKLYYYIQNLKDIMLEKNAHSINEFILKYSGSDNTNSIPETGLQNNSNAVAESLSNPAYQNSSNSGLPKKISSKLHRFDCLSCDICIPVCPNAANFSFKTGKLSKPKFLYKTEHRNLTSTEDGNFKIVRKTQIGNIVEFCNECGNCDTFCPELGGPFKQKPNFFLNPALFKSSSKKDGFSFASRKQLLARIDSAEYGLIYDEPSDKYVWYTDSWSFVFDKNSELVDFKTKCDFEIKSEIFLVMRTIFGAINGEPARYPHNLLLMEKYA